MAAICASVRFWAYVRGDRALESARREKSRRERVVGCMEFFRIGSQTGDGVREGRVWVVNRS